MRHQRNVADLSAILAACVGVSGSEACAVHVRIHCQPNVHAFHIVGFFDQTQLGFVMHRHPYAELCGVHEKAGIENTFEQQYRLVQARLAQHHDLFKMGYGVAATDREAIAFLIMTGAYVGVLPDRYAAAWVEQGLLAAIAPEQMTFCVPMAVATRGGRG